jgi:hypothetical protein
MASPDSSGRILGIEDADSTPQEADSTARFDRAHHVILAKPCVEYPGGTGTIDFHGHRAKAAVPHILKWSW